MRFWPPEYDNLIVLAIICLAYVWLVCTLRGMKEPPEWWGK